MQNQTNRNQTVILIVVVLLVTILAAAVALIAFQMGQQSGQTGPGSNLGSTTDLATSAAVATPRIVTNTPSPTTSPTPTSSTTPTPTVTPTPTFTPSPTPIVVIKHVNALGRLETTEFAMRTVIDLSNDPANLWEEFFGSDQLMLVAEGEVVAGFDLDKVADADIKVQGTQVEIILPAPEILYSRIDNERTYVYQRNTGLLVSPDNTLESRARQLAEESLVNWALERDIEEAAESVGRIRLENLLRSLGFTDVEIKVEGTDL
jgi:hypothetical protein